MNESGISRRTLFEQLFGGLALAVGGPAANAHGTGMEQPMPNVPASTVSDTFDDEGRLLSVTRDGVTRNVATA